MGRIRLLCYMAVHLPVRSSADFSWSCCSWSGLSYDFSHHVRKEDMTRLLFLNSYDRIEVEFQSRLGVLLNQSFHREEVPPLPDHGDLLEIEGQSYKVARRRFVFALGTTTPVRIELWLIAYGE